MTSAPLRFAALGGAIAVAVGASALPLALSRSPTAVLWGLVGWLAMSVIGVAGGAWTISGHGRDGVAFPLALGVCMLSRLACLAAGLFVAAAGRGMEAVGAYLVGLLVGYLPVQVFEVIWYTRSTRIKVDGDDGSSA